MDTAIKIGMLMGVMAGLLIPTLAVATGAMGPGSSGSMMPGMMDGGSMMGSMMAMDSGEMRAMHEECLEMMAHHAGAGNETQPVGGS